MATRRYNVKGIKDFIVLAGIFFFLCIWAVKDAWYPSAKVLKDHPRLVEVSFPVAGMIKEFNVMVGDSVSPPKEEHEATVLASLSDARLNKKFEELKAAYVDLQEGSPEKAAMLKEIGLLKSQLEQHTLHCPKLGKEKGGKVRELLASRYDTVEAGQPVMVIEPNKGFYLFNKSLAIISFIAFWIFLGVHFMTQ